MRTPQQTRSASSSSRMVEAAVALMSTGGLGAVTVAAVAREAGASNGALYHRFGDRTGLLLAAQQHALAAIEVEMVAAFTATADEPDDEQAVRSLARTAIAMYGEHRLVLRALLVEGRTVPELAPATDRHTHAVAATITGWLRARLGADGPQAEAAYRLIHSLGIVRALLEEERVSPVALPDAVLAEALATAVLAVVRA